MHLLVCAATDFEIKPTIEFLKSRQTNTTTLVTGVGLLPAAYQLTRSIFQIKPDFIIQAGIAGSLDSRLSLNQTVVVESETIGDLGVEENGRFSSAFDIGLVSKDAFPWKNSKLSNNNPLLKQSGLAIVESISVNEISTDNKRIELYKKTGAAVESMEGAALHYVGLMENIPFLQIRSLSNFAGERDKSKWTIGAAIAALNFELQQLLVKNFNL